MTSVEAFDKLNEAKADMDHIYNRPDPRAYFRELRDLEYEIPANALPIFRKVIDARRDRSEDDVRVLDLGCSYGINAALLRHDLSMTDLYDRWAGEALSGVPSESVIADDRDFFEETRNSENVELFGLDPAEAAVGYAEDVGLIEGGFPLDLESGGLPTAAGEEMSGIDLVISTGCVGYVTETSFEKLLPPVTAGRPAWLANFVLRLFPFEPIATMLGEQGYVTEKLQGQTFRQRRFATTGEQRDVVEQMEKRGISPAAENANGRLVAEFFLSRPARDAEAFPLGPLLSA